MSAECREVFVRIDVRRSVTHLAGVVLGSVLLVASCGDAAPPATLAPHDPYPYTTPTPPAEPTQLDGVYARFVTTDVVGADTPCRRCPPYRLAVGYDLLDLERGVFEVYHFGTGYMSVGHYVVDGDSITLFNDPNCPSDRGSYSVASSDGAWSFDSSGDPCAFDRVRERFFGSIPWRRILPPEGIYEDGAGSALALLDGYAGFFTASGETAGSYAIDDGTLDIEMEGCTAGFDWDMDDGVLRIKTTPVTCPWADDLAHREWIPVG